MSVNRLQTRNRPAVDLSTRVVSLAARGQAPATLDEESRSVQVVAATEQPVEIWDWDRGRVQEILLLSGLRTPDQVPLLDSHSRWSVNEVLGSAREFRPEGDKLLARLKFSTAAEGEAAWIRVKEGHLTDVSIGYRVEKSTWVEDGQTAAIDGREFTGPVKVVTRWKIHEISVCPIGADPQAKARAAAEKPKPKEATMNPRFRAYLVSRGLSPDATDEQARQFAVDHNIAESDIPADFQPEERRSESAPAPEPAPPADQPSDQGRAAADPAQIAQEAIAAERARAAEIRGMGARFDLADLAEELINSGASVERARERFLDRLAERQPGPEGVGHRITVGTEDRDKFRAATQDAILVRAGLTVDSPAPGHDELTGYTLRELARECLVRAGIRPPANVLDMVGRALTSSDLPNILSNVANRRIMEGYEAAGETWSIWCGDGSVPDFKPQTLLRLAEFGDLDEIPEHAEYKYDSIDETQETVQVATFGKMIALTRQMIINDDLEALTGIPAAMGEAAARKVADVAYAVLIANAAMADGIALFHADHGNLAAAGAAPNITTLGEAIKAMKLQKDIRGLRRLTIRPEYFIAPVAYEAQMEQFFNSEYEGTQEKPGLKNIYAGSYFTRVYEPRLDDDSATAWYLAGPKGKFVKVYFLNGNQTPYTESKQGWNVDGVEYKVRIDAAAAAIDHRFGYKNPGA